MNGIAASYAQALYTLAKEEGLEELILYQLKTLQESFAQEPKFLRLLSMPNLGKQERCQIVDESLGEKVHPYVRNFLKILTEKGETRIFDSCAKAYREQYNEDKGILAVLVVTAAALSEAQSEKLQQKLEHITGKTVELQTRIDPDCLGGIRLDFDGKRVDGTVKNRLETLRGQLNNTVL